MARGRLMPPYQGEEVPYNQKEALGNIMRYGRQNPRSAARGPTSLNAMSLSIFGDMRATAVI